MKLRAPFDFTDIAPPPPRSARSTRLDATRTKRAKQRTIQIRLARRLRGKV